MKKLKEADGVLCNIIIKNIWKILDSRKITQTLFCDLVQKEYGVYLTEESLSRYINRQTKSVPVRLITIASEVLGVSIMDLMDKNYSVFGSLENLAKFRAQEKPEMQEITAHTVKQFMDSLFYGQKYIYDTTAKEHKGTFSSITGEWHLYFISTRSAEPDNILHGIMRIETTEAGFCYSSVELETKKGFFKNYSGLVFGSTSTQSWYCFLKADTGGSSDIAEFTSLIFNHIEFNKKNDCILALALTSAAGKQRFPTTQRVLLTRNAILEKDFERIKTHLYMNSSTITVAKGAYKDIEHKAPKLWDFLSNFVDTHSHLVVPVLSVRENLLIEECKSKGAIINESEVHELIAMLRHRAKAGDYCDRYNKINHNAENNIYRLLVELGYFTKDKEKKTAKES